MCITTLNVTIIPLETPKALRACNRCKTVTPFYSSGKFRVNAQQKSIDVWLIYKCERCDSTWNVPIRSRVHTGTLDQELHVKWMTNDPETAWQAAFRTDSLRRMCHGVVPGLPYRLELDGTLPEQGELKLALACKYPIDARLDKVLCDILGLSRSRLARWVEDGRVVPEPGTGLHSKVAERTVVTVYLPEDH
ncbi:DUF1062 domain-containing protein [Gorillibacterium sp. sgz5001074]|uniref:DUF1062 domain-containing protein n=1 Tax=Gorillibacterium sp. sgz5001074 TaxID=3446695 RepID=UPI003F67EAE2